MPWIIPKFIQLVNFVTFSVFYFFFGNRVWLNLYERTLSGNETSIITSSLIIIITLLKSQFILAEHECSTNWGDCKRNKSNQIIKSNKSNTSNQIKSNQMLLFMETLVREFIECRTFLRVLCRVSNARSRLNTRVRT